MHIRNYVKEMNYTATYIGDKEATKISEILMTNTTLTTLNLGC